MGTRWRGSAPARPPGARSADRAPTRWRRPESSPIELLPIEGARAYKLADLLPSGPPRSAALSRQPCDSREVFGIGDPLYVFALRPFAPISTLAARRGHG